jgi:HD superfamily phosphohydrolase
MISSLNRAFVLRNLASYKAEESVIDTVAFQRLRHVRLIKSSHKVVVTYRIETRDALDAR